MQNDWTTNQSARYMIKISVKKYGVCVILRWWEKHKFTLAEIKRANIYPRKEKINWLTALIHRMSRNFFVSSCDYVCALSHYLLAYVAGAEWRSAQVFRGARERKDAFSSTRARPSNSRPAPATQANCLLTDIGRVCFGRGRSLFLYGTIKCTTG